MKKTLTIKWRLFLLYQRFSHFPLVNVSHVKKFVHFYTMLRLINYQSLLRLTLGDADSLKSLLLALHLVSQLLDGLARGI